MQRILVIEDENDIRQLLRFNLEREGFAVLEAADGLGGLHMATSELPDLVVLDLMLPGMDGCDVCRRLKAQPVTAAIPVLMLTARGEEVDRIVGLTLGADDYVVKPSASGSWCCASGPSCAAAAVPAWGRPCAAGPCCWTWRPTA